LYPGVEETLQRFDEKQSALVTSKESDFAKTILDRLGIAQYFDFIVGGEMVAGRKPHPRPVLLALEHFGTAPEESLMIGDSENDILAGKAARTHTCGVTYGFRTREQLLTSDPEYVVDRLGEIDEYFV
ncbi:MAG TPA: HAD-IA family hydrolase, partial [Blastocatellia bacterium]|nr:HAD-IA family hydrolase [Blastocatellia bacterium]